MKAFVNKHPVLTYFALTFVISWGGVLVVIGGPAGMADVKAQDNPLFPLAVLAMVAGPSVTGILLTGVLDGRAGLRELRSRLLQWRVDPRWYLVALLAAPLLAISVSLTLSLASPQFRPALLVTGDKAALLLLGLAAALTAGLFEELGWTGFAIPRIKRRYGVLATGLIVGVLWSAWHLLVVAWGIGDRAGDIPLAVFMIVDGLAGLPAFRVLMVWVYDRSESLFLGMLMHVSITATTLILTPQTTGVPLLAYGVAFAGAMWIVIAALAVANHGQLARWPLRRWAGRTAPFRGPNGKTLPGSLAEVDYLKLGGVDQWVMMRGERLTNPPLILLHGGPGFSETHFFRQFNAALETSFTVVYWDQRGAGKSFDPDIPASSMTVEQFIADLDDLVEVVRKRVGQDKVTILGHSWGSALGVLYAARFPEKVAVYVGCEQIGDWEAAESASYAFALTEAQRLHNRKALKELHAMGAPPYSARNLLAERTWLSRFQGELSAKALWKMRRLVIGGGESSIFDVPNLVRGFFFSLDAMWAEVSRLNLLRGASALQLPVFFFLGRRDCWVPPQTSVAYFNALAAPLKKLVWFEESGHEPFVDEPARFNAAMIELVRPLAESPQRYTHSAA